MSALIRPDTVSWLAQVLHRESGYVLAADKAYLVESRLRPIARTHGFTTVVGMLESLRQDPDRALLEEIVEAMTIQETSFFRDGSPFAVIESQLLPRIVAATPAARPIRIWCAAASTGQEPYSLAIICRENSVRLAGRRVEILASDISPRALSRARLGVYSDAEMRRGMPSDLWRRYFRETEGGWQADRCIAEMISFRPINLRGELDAIGPFDLVLCRNVLIYFDAGLKRLVLDRIATRMTDHGHLVLGAAETVVGITRSFEPAPGLRGIFRKRQAKD